MTVAGQAVTRAFYPGQLRSSYFFGCSTGGREGLMEAQRVMNRMHDALPTCKEDAFTGAVIKACDALDGVTDGIISDVADCHWNASQLIGLKTPCGTITASDAARRRRSPRRPRRP